MKTKSGLEPSHCKSETNPIYKMVSKSSQVPSFPRNQIYKANAIRSSHSSVRTRRGPAPLSLSPRGAITEARGAASVTESRRRRGAPVLATQARHNDATVPPPCRALHPVRHRPRGSPSRTTVAAAFPEVPVAAASGG